MRFTDGPAEYARGAGKVVEMWHLPETTNNPERWLLWVKNYSGQIVMKTETDSEGIPRVVPVQETIRSDKELAMQRYFSYVQEYIGSEYTQQELDERAIQLGLAI